MIEIEAIKQRLDNIENQQAIKDLHRSYIYHVNSHRWDDVLNCFTKDATADIGMHGSHQGAAELRELFTVKIAKVNENWNGGHFATQPIISIQENRATGCWLLYICVFDAEMAAGPTVKWIQGRHDCDYRKQDGEWKIHYIKFTSPWPTPKR